MRRTNIYLDENQLQALKRLAVTEDQSVAAVVRDAVDTYLKDRASDDVAWSKELKQLLERVQSRIPPDITPDEIEADITSAREEVRQARRAARRR
ncbi:MAG: ribbon-helix-helix protein, CopG family [Chloroflexia bacterium]|jgi:hypothetical protein|nr:ribbon-helix-helix protein, CopG family [Chloroflexia bacterium]